MKCSPDDAPRSYPVPLPIKLSLLWAALMGLYIYNDYFSLYVPGTLDMMASGTMGPLGPATDLVLIAIATLLAVPALMIFLPVALPPLVSKWTNIGLAAFYSAVQGLTLIGSPLFYQLIVVVEIIVTLSIMILAWRWPRGEQVSSHLSEG